MDDPFAVVRAWFAAFNASDAEAVSLLYADDAVFDHDLGILSGRPAIREMLAAHFDALRPGLDGGARRRLRTVGQVEHGFAAEWVGRERSADAPLGREIAGYDYFQIANGRIVRQREAVRTLDARAGEVPSDEASTEVHVSTRRYPERPIVGVGAVIVQDGRVVLIKRRFEPLAGQWSLPGGTLELGESLESGVAREVFEETGLEVAVGPVVDVFDRILLDPERKVRYHFVLIDYLCRPTGGHLRAGSDVADAVFASPAEVASYRLTPKAASIVERGLRLAEGTRAASDSGQGESG